MSNKCTRAFVFVEGVGNDICCPFVDQEENLFFLLQDCGEVIAIDPSGETERIHGTNGQPSGATFDEQGILYISDFAHGAVLAIKIICFFAISTHAHHFFSLHHGRHGIPSILKSASYRLQKACAGSNPTLTASFCGKLAGVTRPPGCVLR